MKLAALGVWLQRSVCHSFVPLLLIAGASEFVLSRTLPDEAPSRETLVGWERIRGVATFGQATAHYDFYVNPARPGLYELTHYRVAQTVGSDGLPPEVMTEKLLWNAKPSAPLLAFELIDGRWRRMAHGSDAYRDEMMIAIRLYGVHNQELQKKLDRSGR